MDTEEAFRKVTESIKDEKYDTVRPQLDVIMSSTDDVAICLKCASILKTIDDEKGCQEIVDSVISQMPSDPQDRFDIALSIRALGRPKDAYDFMKDMENDVPKIPEISRTLFYIGKPGEALDLLSKCPSLALRDRLLKCDILCALSRFGEAEQEANAILNDEGDSYVVMVNLVSVMMKAGKAKEATKLAKAHLKQDKKNVDSLALEAYVMWINGKVPAAANYANRALQMDYSHSGALEVMAMCLITKQKYVQAKMLAGVINEKDPSDPAVMRILDACRIASSA